MKPTSNLWRFMPNGFGLPTLVLVRLGKFVGVTEYHLPLAVFQPVGVGAAKRPRLPAITDVSGHVLQIDCEGKIVAAPRCTGSPARVVFRGSTSPRASARTM
jgi:hypothetical protein